MYKRLIDAQQTKNKVDPEVTLQFLKSAIYYFLTDKENSQGHLNAIESILGFSDAEKCNIDKARAYKWKAYRKYDKEEEDTQLKHKLWRLDKI